jgi:hypothetical protein
MFKEKDYVQFTLGDRHIFGTVIGVEGNIVKVSDGNEVTYVDCSKVKIEKVSFSTPNKKEMVNHPDHYHPGTYEAINVIEAWGLNFNLGSAIKYISRCGLKPDAELSKKEKALEDLKKAAWYVNREIERLSK